jgi:hypothetical protein
MSIQPLGSALATPTIPVDFGQLSDIATVIPTNDPHLLHGGSYETSGMCAPGVVISGTDPCTHQDMQRGLGTLTYVDGYPGTVLTGVQCLGPISENDLQDAALRNVDVRVDRTIQDNIVGGLIPLAKFNSRVAAKKYGPLGDAVAVSRCEYFGRAIIHLHQRMAEQWMGNQIIRVGRHLETVDGAYVSLSCGVVDTTIAITGHLTVLRGNNRVLGMMQAAPATLPTTTRLNNWFVPVQTSVTVFNDCNFAVLLTGI